MLLFTVSPNDVVRGLVGIAIVLTRSSEMIVWRSSTEVTVYWLITKYTGKGLVNALFWGCLYASSMAFLSLICTQVCKYEINIVVVYRPLHMCVYIYSVINNQRYNKTSHLSQYTYIYLDKRQSCNNTIQQELISLFLTSLIITASAHLQGHASGLR